MFQIDTYNLGFDLMFFLKVVDSLLYRTLEEYCYDKKI